MDLTPYETLLNRLAKGETVVTMKGRLTHDEYQNMYGRIDHILSVEYSELTDETLVVAGLSEYSTYDLHAAVDCGEITPDQMATEIKRRFDVQMAPIKEEFKSCSKQ